MAINNQAEKNVTENIQFSILPGYALFIRDQYLIPYIKEQLRLSREVDLPMLQYFNSITEEELIEISIQEHTETLQAIIENRIKEHVDKSLQEWKDNQIPVLNRDQVAARDITLGSFIRKQALLKFIPFYTSDINNMLELIKEIDVFCKELDIASTDVYLDILKERLYEQDEELLKSQRLLLQAQSISHTGNWMWNHDTKELIWSDEVYRIYGLEPQSQTTSDTIGLYNHPDDIALVEESITQAIQFGKPIDMYYRIILADGTIKTLHAVGEIKAAKKGEPNIHGTLQDVTRQKQSEKQLKEYQEFIQKIADTAPSIIASYNLKTGKYNFISQGLEKILGYNTDEALAGGTDFFINILHPDDIEALMARNALMLERANAQNPGDAEFVAEFKYRMLHTNGTYRWVHTFGTVFSRDDDYKVEQVLNISIDITEQETAEQALFQRNVQLQQSNISLEEYAYVASHDLKEPLRKIATFSDRLLSTQKDRLTEEGKTYLDKIISSSTRMQTLINDLLSISMLSGEKKHEPTDLNHVCTEAVSALEYKIEELNATINIADLPTINAIPSQMRQLFQNLVGNSLKFTRQGVDPIINITSRFLKPQDVSEYNLGKAKKYLELAVSDNGIGFDNQYASRIFTIFQRLHAKTDYEGNGIGLSICRKVAENHGGAIFASGIPNEGATFTVIIPS